MGMLLLKMYFFTKGENCTNHYNGVFDVFINVRAICNSQLSIFTIGSDGQSFSPLFS